MLTNVWRLSYLIGLFCLLGVQASDNTFCHFPLKSYVLIEVQSGKCLASEHAARSVSPASLTKLMTMYIVSKALKRKEITLKDQVTVSKKAGTMPGSRMFIAPNTQVKIEDLIQGIIVQSGNDASVALAEHLAGSEIAFVNSMNQTAQQLGMFNTHFVNVSGLPDTKHFTTAQDMGLLVRALILDFPEYYQWYSQKSFKYSGIEQRNRNRLLWLDNIIDGLKTGETQEAGYCLAASAIKENKRLIAIVMGAPSKEMRFQSAQALLAYGFRQY